MSEETTEALDVVGLIGRPVKEAEEKCQASGHKLRVVWEDGENYMVTMDFDSRRVNVGVESGVVTAIKGRG